MIYPISWNELTKTHDLLILFIDFLGRSEENETFRPPMKENFDKLSSKLVGLQE